MPKKTKSFDQNTLGRDFVVGDIHGAYDLVLRGMHAVQFQPDVDRLFSVGDLIDRGQESHRVLRFLAQPYVHAIPGNHDNDFASMSLTEIRMLGEANWNGMGWTRGVPDGDLLAIREKLSQLPLVIQIQTQRGTVGLVHGDVPAGMDWQTFVEAIDRGDEAVQKIALFGRNRIQSRDETGVKGIDRIFCGHTIQWDGPRRFGNVYAIDTGAVFQEIGGVKGSLTIASLVCRTDILVPRSDPSAVAPVMAATISSTGPFGSYTA